MGLQSNDNLSSDPMVRSYVANYKTKRDIRTVIVTNIQTDNSYKTSGDRVKCIYNNCKLYVLSDSENHRWQIRYQLSIKKDNSNKITFFKKMPRIQNIVTYVKDGSSSIYGKQGMVEDF